MAKKDNAAAATAAAATHTTTPAPTPAPAPAPTPSPLGGPTPGFPTLPTLPSFQDDMDHLALVQAKMASLTTSYASLQTQFDLAHAQATRRGPLNADLSKRSIQPPSEAELDAAAAQWNVQHQEIIELNANWRKR